MKEVTAFVGVRSGSERVKNKNIKNFCDTTLLDLKLETLKKVDGLSGIVVSSDCDDILMRARKHNVEIHKRDDYHASSKCSNSEYFYNISEIVKTNSVMYAPVTSPFVSVETFNECMKKFQTSDNVVTTNIVKHHLWLDGKPLNYELDKSPNSQDLPDIHAINYGCCLLSRNDLALHKNVVCRNPIFYVLDEIEGIDIDTSFDFTISEMLYRKLKNL
tara:strand:+ start:5834 stop:6484 length:651 start_codon:yes stop_codon:yes gene_type:complete